jgi:hypothetical protein
MSLALSILSLLPIPLMIWISLVMWRRKQHRIYAVFWAYLCFQIATLVIEFSCKGISYKTFFYVYWTSSFLNLILQLFLLQDIFSRTLGKYPQLKTISRQILQTALLGLWATAVLVLLLANSVHTMSKMIATGDLVMSIVAVTLFIFVAASAIVLGIKWNSAVCGMAAGLGLIGMVNALALVILLYSASLSRHVTFASWLNTLGHDAAVAIFAFYFLPKPKEVVFPKKVRPELLDWAESMRGSLPR